MQVCQFPLFVALCENNPPTPTVGETVVTLVTKCDMLTKCYYGMAG